MWKGFCEGLDAQTTRFIDCEIFVFPMVWKWSFVTNFKDVLEIHHFQSNKNSTYIIICQLYLGRNLLVKQDLIERNFSSIRIFFFWFKQKPTTRN